MSDHSPFQVALDQNFAYVASFDSHIYKIDKNNGLIIWSFAIPNQFWPDTEVIVDDGPLVFFTDRAGILRALDLNFPRPYGRGSKFGSKELPYFKEDLAIKIAN